MQTRINTLREQGFKEIDYRCQILHSMIAHEGRPDKEIKAAIEYMDKRGYYEDYYSYLIRSKLK